MRILRLAAAITLAGVAAAACSTNAGADPGPGSTATHPQQGGSAAPQTMTSRDDLVALHPATWDAWHLVDPSTVEVTFLAGPADCEGVKVTTDETAGQVTIGLQIGSLPTSGECRAIALTTTTRVRLSRPLDSREVGQP
jgi:hypothetical protein